MHLGCPSAARIFCGSAPRGTCLPSRLGGKVPDETEERGTAQGASATTPVTVILKENVPEPPKRRTDWVALASSAPAVLGFLGLIVYAVVRVGHDAFYARFGVTAEEVGLSQATILGRAALYFVFFLTAAIALLGVAAMIARPTTAIGTVHRKKNQGGSEVRSGAFWARLGVGFLVLVAGLAGVVVAGFAGSWPLAIAIGLVIPLALGASLAGRLSKGLSKGQRAAVVGLLFGLLAAWSAAVAFLVADRGSASSPGAGSFSAPSRWLLFAFCVLAVVLASVSLLRQFEMRSTGAEDGDTDGDGPEAETNSIGAQGRETDGDGSESERQQIYRDPPIASCPSAAGTGFLCARRCSVRCRRERSHGRRRCHVGGPLRLRHPRISGASGQ